MSGARTRVADLWFSIAIWTKAIESAIDDNERMRLMAQREKKIRRLRKWTAKLTPEDVAAIAMDPDTAELLKFLNLGTADVP
ncbi:MAG: hypothetical protein ACLPKB_18820 [Xanthobacteraceae bacterium]